MTRDAPAHFVACKSVAISRWRKAEPVTCRPGIQSRENLRAGGMPAVVLYFRLAIRLARDALIVSNDRVPLPARSRDGDWHSTARRTAGSFMCRFTLGRS